MNARDFDVVVLGATGFTGQITANYLATIMPRNLRLGIAGRNLDKLKPILSELQLLNPNVQSVVADVIDASSIDELASRTKVLITTVGPFWIHGPIVVDACIKRNTHFLDCTGETHYIKKIIQEQHDNAVSNKTVIVPSCAFEAFLPDIGAFLVAKHFKSKGIEIGTVRYSIVKFNSAGVSGGTLHSLSTALSLKGGIMNDVFADVSCLEPAGSNLTPQKASGSSICEYSKELGGWQSWFLAERGNVRYVRRSAALLNYGSGFRFHETMAHTQPFSAYLYGIGQVVVLHLLYLSFIRRIVGHFIPTGSGPSAKKMKEGSFGVHIIGESADKRHQCVASISFDEDPGYKATAVLLAQSALCLLLDQAKLRTAGKDDRQFKTLEGGVLTGVSAMGEVVLERLEQAGFVFTVHDA
ncbi:hypothetical protein BSLG_002344 [Batrachochytrium salamandrivorans]|nr:hypothetical protein BASA83_000053 [Batrachochytrium salamandrivorans]KAJ1343318.1 hypothetical protein BSLG_002344 [Batrachochytrium salamandrivorans]